MKLRSRGLLLVWLLGILFPVAGLRGLSPAFRGAFDAVFAPLWVHIVMHAALFAGLVVLLFAATHSRVDGKTAGMALVAVLVVGVLQEGMQFFGAGNASLIGAAFDLGVDISGGMVGLGMVAVTEGVGVRGAG